MFFNFRVLLLKIYIFEVVPFLSCLLFIQSPQFPVVVHIYKIRVFDEACFLLTIRMSITGYFQVGYMCKELSPTYMHDIERSGLVGSCDK